MSQLQKLWGALALLVALLAIVMFILIDNESDKKKSSRPINSNLTKEIADLKSENEQLKIQIADLKIQYQNLKTVLNAYEKEIVVLENASRSCYQLESGLETDIPKGLANEPVQIRQIYREMLGEKKRWDQYQHQQYKDVLESTVEPRLVEIVRLEFKNEANKEHFLELDEALKLHRRLIRDVRMFHDEIEYQKRQLLAQQPYQLYDLKFELSPFARESALVDALQQAMSALSSGVYQQEAEEVLDRIGYELTKPIQQLYEQPQEAAELKVHKNYQYSLYIVFGKKLMDYSETLARQSSVTLGPAAFGELDFFNRRLYDSLYDLYVVGQEEAIDSSQLDLDELEKFLYSRH
jgi:hypothetical protein